MIKTAGVLCILAMCGAAFPTQVYARNMKVCAARKPESAPYCTSARPVLKIGATAYATVASDGAGVGQNSTDNADLLGSVTNPAAASDYVSVSSSTLSDRSGLPIGKSVLTAGDVKKQVSFNTPLTRSRESVSEPMSLALFGMGLLGIALLIRRRPVEKIVKNREQVRASNPRLSTERS